MPWIGRLMGLFLLPQAITARSSYFKRHDWNPLLLTSPQHVGIHDLTWLPRRYSLATSDGKDIRIWDVRTGETEAIYQGHTNVVFALSASPDGHYLASGSGWDHKVYVWDLTTAHPLLTLEGSANQLHAIAWSPDST